MNKTYFLPHRIDAGNAGLIDKMISEFREWRGNIKLDAGRLRYLSNEGIRVLTELAKKQGNLTIDNVGDGVFSMLTDAGVTGLFTINRKLEKFTNDGWDVVGVGASGTVYKMQDDTVIKVYSEGIGLDYVNQERSLARQAFISGVPTAIPFQNAKVGDQYATIFELENSSKLGEQLNDPDRFDGLMDQYIAMMKDLHSLEDKRGFFPELQELWLCYEYMVREGLKPEDADLVIDLYRNSKRSKNLLHGEMHPGNVLISNGEMVLVDMATMSTGPDFLDVITVFRLTMYGPDVGLLDIGETSTGIKRELFKPFWEAFVRRYFEVDDQDTIDKITEDVRLVTALDLMLSINTIPPEKAREHYRQYGQHVMDTIIRPNEDRIRRIMTEGKISY